MGRTIHVYINDNFGIWYDKLFAMADINGEKRSVSVGKSVQQFVRNINNEPQLLLDRKEWHKVIPKMNKKELIFNHKQIPSLNDMLMREICKK